MPVVVLHLYENKSLARHPDWSWSYNNFGAFIQLHSYVHIFLPVSNTEISDSGPIPGGLGGGGGAVLP